MPSQVNVRASPSHGTEVEVVKGQDLAALPAKDTLLRRPCSCARARSKERASSNGEVSAREILTGRTPKQQPRTVHLVLARRQ